MPRRQYPDAILPKREAHERINKLFEKFPHSVDIFELIEKKAAWELVEENTHEEAKAEERSRLQFLSSYMNDIRFVYKALPGVYVDILFFKTRGMSIAQILRDRLKTDEYGKIPTNELIAPALNFKIGIEGHRRQLLSYMVYADLRLFLSIIDILLEEDKTLIFKKNGFTDRFFNDDKFFFEVVRREPVILQSLSGLFRLKFFTSFWKPSQVTSVNLFLSSEGSYKASDVRAVRRALLFIKLFEPVALESLSAAELTTKFHHFKICSRVYTHTRLGQELRDFRYLREIL